MNLNAQLENEWTYLSPYKLRAITISSTAKRNSANFAVLPRRFANDTAVASFLVHEEKYLQTVVQFFDGKVEFIYVDVEQKQAIDLFKHAKSFVRKSKLVAVKPNDVTLEACDLLLRDQFQDDLVGKNIIILGTGNLASKMALRAAERQANVYLHGRTQEKTATIMAGLNSILPAYAPKIHLFEKGNFDEKVAAIVSFLAGPYWAEEKLLSYINKETFIIDGGINNFSKSFIRKMLQEQTKITRLDVRLAIAYQFLSEMAETTRFFEHVYGMSEIEKDLSDLQTINTEIDEVRMNVSDTNHDLTEIESVRIVAGGWIGAEGSVIVDQITNPIQVIGIADGMGGIKAASSLTNVDKQAIEVIKATILKKGHHNNS